MQEQRRILGLDVGERRIGVAISDAMGIARPLMTAGRTYPRKDAKDMARLARNHGAVAVVVGNPLHMSGEVSAQARRVQEFAETVGQHCGVPVHLWDERLSSHAAEELLDAQGFPRGPERKRVLDQAAAVVILQGWLDAQGQQHMPGAETQQPDVGMQQSRTIG